MPKSIFFYRDFHGFTGGHLKVWDYFQHVNASQNYQAHIYFTPNSQQDENNPWVGKNVSILPTWQPEQADILFIAGLDWQVIPESLHYSSKPIVNLIQGVRHVDSHDERYAFLKYKAIRISVSEQITSALHATQQVQYPIFTIPNGLDFSIFPKPYPYLQRPYQLCISGLKQPALATQLYQCVTAMGINNVLLLTQAIPRKQFLEYLTQSQLTVFLPEHREGFYLPALEGMKLGTLVICPDCIGNRDFCLDEINCFMPHYEIEHILQTINKAFRFSLEQKESLLQAAQETAINYDIARERQQFHKILNDIESM
ncbi:MAG: glycosyltransferase [Thiotrichaceae bacterium]|nr:glycosyltransferase [Thiotrichaceae bacterium]